ncbi:uncharacterized protein LOC110246702 [Exaiptasia diaphana]|uniref:Uncharacterized protein n=1 Tax=Exaiptasia diaphana TaxID=2652724 RepID=A0A913YRP8_EXADI|nr:uncharacterized protein LOC110246702 [Exaiptasia diaphana]
MLYITNKKTDHLNRFSDNQRAQDAINITIFHWGIHGWIVYTLVGLTLGFLSHNKGMPMTMRSCFYPLIGDKIYGTFALFAPWYPIGNAAGKVYGSNRYVAMVCLAIPFYAWILLEILQVVEVGLAYVGWAVLFGFIAYGTGVRAEIREKFHIVGNLGEDMFAMMLTYPLAALQMEEQMNVEGYPGNGMKNEAGKTNMALDAMEKNEIAKSDEANHGIHDKPTMSEISSL